MQVNVAEAKAKLSELIARAERGEDVVIARGGRPVVQLTLVSEGEPASTGYKTRRLGAFAHLGGLQDPDLWLRPDPDTETALEAWETASLLP